MQVDNLQSGRAAWRRWVLLTGASLAAQPFVARADDLELRGFSESQPQAVARASPCVMGAQNCDKILLGVSVDGATIFSQTELSALYQDKLAEPADMGELVSIAQRITDYYRAHGYFLSRAAVPPQDASGVARIEMIEGRIEQVRFEGDGADIVRGYFAGLDQGGAARIADLERAVALAGDAPGVRVRTTMTPDPDDPHRHVLIVHADRVPIQARIGLDNRGSDRAGPWQASARVQRNQVFAARDSAGLALFTTPVAPAEFTLVEASYAYGFTDGARLRAAINTSRAHDGANSMSADIGGDGVAASLAYEYPLLRRRGRGLWLGAAFDMRHQENDWASGGGYADELRVARVGLRGLLNENGRASSVFVQASFGLPILGASGPSSLRRSRADADGKFAKLEVFASHYLDIGDHFGLYAAVTGQYSFDPLLNAEEFTVGGAPIGRGYFYGEISGDRGLAGELEFRAGYDPEPDAINFVQGYVFYDAGQVWNIGSDSDALASAGLGVRVTFNERIVAGWEAAKPLTRTPFEETDKDWRQFLLLSASY